MVKYAVNVTMIISSDSRIRTFFTISLHPYPSLSLSNHGPYWGSLAGIFTRPAFRASLQFLNGLKFDCGAGVDDCVGVVVV